VRKPASTVSTLGTINVSQSGATFT
jgi:hypothetical protein